MNRLALSVRPLTLATAVCVGATFLVALPTPAAAAGCGGVSYGYDAAGQLAGVMDGDGLAAQYRYDDVGNITSVENLGTPDVAVLSFSPARGPEGTAVTITGGCFSTTAVDNT